MSFWKSMRGAILLTVAGLLVIGLIAVGAMVYRVTHPGRQIEDSPTLASVVAPVEEVAFAASDGVQLTGWHLRGRPNAPCVVLCHDLGERKGHLLDLAVLLNKSGFGILAFDFRGHGSSDGSGSSLGLAEKRDVIGAVDYLAEREDVVGDRFGVYGVGVGAHAAVLAAADRPGIKVLVLDGLFPDPGFAVVRKVYGSWSFGVRYLGFAPRAALIFLQLARNEREQARQVISNLVERDILLLAPAGDIELTNRIQEMYESIPERQDADANFIVLPATRLDDLYGEDRALYEKRVVSFFESRLPPR
jgi:pimeloyl-ACP methyl ester carboxylesterase